MLLTDYDENEVRELFKEDGRREGIKQGETKFGALIQKLCRLGLQDEIQRVVDDEEYRNQLYRKYGVIS